MEEKKMTYSEAIAELEKIVASTICRLIHHARLNC